MQFTKIQIIKIGPLPIQTWGLLLAIGMLLALLFTLHEAKVKKMHSDDFVDLFIVIFIAGLLGAKLFHVLRLRD